MSAATVVVDTVSGPGSRAIRYTVGLVFIIGGLVQGGSSWSLVLIGLVLMHLAATDTCLLRRLFGQPVRQHEAPEPQCAIDRRPTFDL